ncbi:MAG: hypothetical protein OXF84_10890 [Bacteroidetes bacterium]|nr:hypothetical protein [Bacteroidota bacterium]
MEKDPFEVIFGFPYPTHPFWGHKAFLPGAKHLRVMKIEQRGHTVFLEDGSVWDIYFFDSAKPTRWIPEKTKVVVRDGDGRSSYYDTLLEEADYDGSVVNARRIEWKDE